MTTIGLISDTHMPKRRRTLSPAVFDLLAGVDLLIHAGDVGDLWVLDQLSRIAPVTAVFGNDESPEAVAALPFLNTLLLSGQRIVVTHGHHQDLQAEWASRADPAWDGKLRTLAAHGLAHGASIVVYGHTHIPGVAHLNGVTLVNPGAISAAGVMRQTIATVARMTLTSGAPEIVFYDAITGGVHVPANDWHLPFAETRARYGDLIFAPDLMAETTWFRTQLLEVFGEDAVLAPIQDLLYACWEEGAPPLTVADLATAYNHARGKIPDAVLDTLWSNPAFAAYRAP